LRKILILGSGLLVFLLAACSSGDTADERENDSAPPAATAVVEEPTALPEPTVESESGGGLLGSALNPLNLLSLGSGGGSEGLTANTGEADPALKAALLTLEDLPPGYSEPVPGGMSFSMETGEGNMDMAARSLPSGCRSPGPTIRADSEGGRQKKLTGARSLTCPRSGYRISLLLYRELVKWITILDFGLGNGRIQGGRECQPASQ